MRQRKLLFRITKHSKHNQKTFDNNKNSFIVDMLIILKVWIPSTRATSEMKVFSKDDITNDKLILSAGGRRGGSPGGVLYIIWVRGRAIGKGIVFHDFGIRNGINFHDFGIRNGIDFRNFCDWYRIGYAFLENWYKVGYIFLKNWYKVGYTFWKNWYKERVCF